MSTPTTCAPSRANARAMAWPMPRLAPVTMAILLLKRFVSIICALSVSEGRVPRAPKVFLSGRRRAPPSGKSSQIHRLHAVHVIEGLVFPGHAPDELVIARAATAMDGPVRRQRDLLVVQKQMPRLLRLAQQMHHDLFAEVEIHVNLRAPPVGVRRKGIPHIASGQFGETHHELAALNAAGVNVFVNHAL